MATTPFPCTRCGACCRWTVALRAAGMPTKNDGSCVHLDGNECSIYERRPLICRTGTRHRLTASICEALQASEGLGREWLPKVA